MTPTQAQLLSNIEAIQQAAVQLHDYLNQEHACLVERDYTHLVDLTALKETTVSQLESLEQQRQQLLGPQQTMENLLADQPRGQTLWQATLKQIGDCDIQNRINGQLIERSQQLTRETLQLMTGQQAAASETTYGPDGQKHVESSLLGKTQA